VTFSGFLLCPDGWRGKRKWSFYALNQGKKLQENSATREHGFCSFFFFLAAVIQNIEERCRDVERKKELEGFCKIREQGEEKPRENLKKKLCDDLMGAGFVL